MLHYTTFSFLIKIIRLRGKQAHKGRCGRHRRWLKPPDCDCWVGGTKYSSSNTYSDDSRNKSLFAKGEMSFGVANFPAILKKWRDSDEYFIPQSSPSPFL